MLEILSDGFRITGLFLIIAFGIVFYRSEKYSFRKNIVIFFLLTVLSYLFAYWQPVRVSQAIFRIMLFFSISLPFAFWLYSKALFDDDFSWSSKYWILAFTIPIMHNLLYNLNEFFEVKFYSHFRIIPYLLSIFFVVLVIFESLKNKNNELVLSRLKKRNIVIIFSAFLALFSVYFFLDKDPLKLPKYFELIQNFVISVFIFLSFYSQFEYKNLFPENSRYKNRKTTNTNVEIHKRIINKLSTVFDNEKIYTRENLTITKLALVINEKEYLLRQAINGELGYTNFNGFLNYYRITEACRLLKENKSKALTFQEIAYQIGYQSIATFNRAFKNEKGSTPSEYVKKIS